MLEWRQSFIISLQLTMFTYLSSYPHFLLLIILPLQVGRWFPSFSIGKQILFVIFIEHLFLSIKFVISRVIPDVPEWVQTARAKEQHARSRALQGLESMARAASLKSVMKRKADEARERLLNSNSSTSFSRQKKE